MARYPGLNVLGGPLGLCCERPLTGFFRDGACNTAGEDRGVHTVCAVITADFLRFSVEKGNDLVTPRPDFDFPGLKPGDSWCLCAARWAEAEKAGMAPKLKLAATHMRTLDVVPLEILKRYAIDLM